MESGTRRWVSLFTLLVILLALDAGLLAAAAPHARVLLGHGILPAALRAGRLASRQVAAVGKREAARAALSILTGLNGWTGALCGLVLRATPAAASAHGTTGSCDAGSPAGVNDADGDRAGRGCCSGCCGRGEARETDRGTSDPHGYPSI